MAEYIFGSGTLIAKRTDIANTPPMLFGVLQEVSLDISKKIEGLVGQYSSPVAFGGGELEIKGKAKFARFQATQFNNLLLNGTQAASSGLVTAVAESNTTATTTFTVSHGATFVEDLGVFYASTGLQLSPVVSGPTTGQYVAGAAGVGTYTIATGDENTALLVYYSYTVSNLQQITLSNNLMGSVPNFEIYLQQNFTVYGVPKTLSVQLYYCVAEKLSMPFTNAKFSIMDMDFMAGANAANQVGTISLSE